MCLQVFFVFCCFFLGGGGGGGGVYVCKLVCQSLGWGLCLVWHLSVFGLVGG